MNTQDSQSELRTKLRKDIGFFKHTFKYYDYIEAPEGTLGGKYPSPRAIEELDSFIDRIIPVIEAYVTTRVKEALELARSKDPHKCEFGHEVYSHNTVDGWCCACEADQAFMEAEIEARVKEVLYSLRNKTSQNPEWPKDYKFARSEYDIAITESIEALTTTTNGRGK